MKQPLFPTTEAEAKKKNNKYSSKANKAALFPTRLREARASKGASQQKAAEAVEVSKSTIGLYENGDTLPDIATVYRLAKYYGVTLGYLLGETAVKRDDATLREVCDYTGLSEEAVELLARKRHDSAFRPLAEALSFLILHETPHPDYPEIRFDELPEEEHERHEEQADNEFTKNYNQWAQNDYTHILQKIAQYFLLKESNIVFGSTDQGKLVKIEDGLHTDRKSNFVGFIPETDIVERVLLSDIEESLKKMKLKNPLRKEAPPCPDEAHKATAPSGSDQMDAGKLDT